MSSTRFGLRPVKDLRFTTALLLPPQLIALLSLRESGRLIACIFVTIPCILSICLLRNV